LLYHNPRSKPVCRRNRCDNYAHMPLHVLSACTIEATALSFMSRRSEGRGVRLTFAYRLLTAAETTRRKHIEF
jgi:hypothetical protein